MTVNLNVAIVYEQKCTKETLLHGSGGEGEDQPLFISIK